jgi:predicted RNA-binding protein with TRAM domain
LRIYRAAEIYARRPVECGKRLQYTIVSIVVAQSSSAARLTGTYTVACPGARGGVSKVEPERGDSVLVPNAPSDTEVSAEIKKMQEAEAAAKNH